MENAEPLDLLLVDEEEGTFLRESPDSMDNLLHIAIRWAFAPPKLAIPLLSAQSKAAGHRVASIYCPTLPGKRKAFISLLRRRPLVAGITTVAMFNPKQLAYLVGLIRYFSPDTLVVLGGHGADNSAEMRSLGDLYISFHGEGALADVVAAVKAGTPPEKIPGVAREAEGKLRLRGSLRYEGIKKVLYPDWSATSTSPLARRYAIEASRGCNFNCSYCSFPGRAGQIFRPVDDVIGEMLHSWKTAGIKRFEFMDSALTSDLGFMADFCAGLRKTGVRFNWNCFGRPDAFVRNPELAADMASAGCRRVQVGVESIHDHILAAMRRGMTRQTVEKALDSLFKAKIKVWGNFIIGFPGETEATVDETADFIIKRPFLFTSLCSFWASEDMMKLAASRPEEYAHLTGQPGKGWKHDGMDYDGSRRLAERAARRINLRKLWFRALWAEAAGPDQP
ncbi:MAG: radical SAM protein [Elusimicrobia bacterium]|nr:radical SAM protein [Elusimicrobiota bacterium]